MYKRIRKNASKTINTLIDSATSIVYVGHSMRIDDYWEATKSTGSAEDVRAFVRDNYSNLDVMASVNEAGAVIELKIANGPYYFNDEYVLTFENPNHASIKTPDNNPDINETFHEEIIEHTTKRGKVLRGVVRAGLKYEEAKAIDEYTFRKNGGWFIREKHLGQMNPSPAKITTVDHLMLEKSSTVNLPTAETLRKAGEVLEKSAQADLSKDRLANTVRRARMAASAENEAAKRLATAKTMQNLADSIEQGKAKSLGKITSRTQIELLEKLLSQAKYERDKTEFKTHEEQQAKKGRAVDLLDLPYLNYPAATIRALPCWRSKIVEELKGKRGASALRSSLLYGEPSADLVEKLRKFLDDEKIKSAMGWYVIDQIKEAARLKRAGINNIEDLKKAAKEFLLIRSDKGKADPIKEAERALIGKNVGIDFFPTPKDLAAYMVKLAEIAPGMVTLEPSAGSGNIADAIRSSGGFVDVVEISDSLRDVLKLKGHAVVDFDFDTHTPTKEYDAIVMNPPFSKRKDAEHIMKAWGMLAEGGRLVAIAGEGVFIGSDKKAVEFRAWLEANGATIERLPSGTFNDKSLLSTTSANARIITISKHKCAGDRYNASAGQLRVIH